ncbi:transporter substrate-binding domain-containing protein [Clostridium aestuarii]|uniref:Transporter substrate-binding domain-containing protein n=1 Tax=Clostridium aestuarii TaxID=338193 RepID=A0ABT4CZI8_9CLOT|nr:transporter substrate-binding domain-containing protein [Clostridium aestuarii]MCY6484401.1 transporter substrate-binding domain-containing protein [Clostridium aestuarii]
MKKINKLLTLLVSFMLILSLVGCGDNKGSEKDIVNENGIPNKIIVGLDDSFPPMGFRSEEDEIIGFDIDMANEMAKRMGVEIEYMPTEWSGVIPSLKSKKFTIIISAMSVSEERKKEIAFSNPYILEKQVIVVKKDNTSINSPENLKDKVVGVQLGSTSDEAIKPLKNTIKKVVQYDKNTEALQDLAIGRLDAVAVDELVARYYIKEHNDKYRVVEKEISKEPIAIGIRKEDTKLKEKFDETLKAMQEDGTMSKISKQWFGEDITKID